MVYTGSSRDAPKVLARDLLTRGGLDTAMAASHGRADAPTCFGGNVFLRVIDPDAVGGREAFLREVDSLKSLSLRPRPGTDRVRLTDEVWPVSRPLPRRRRQPTRADRGKTRSAISDPLRE